MARLRQAINGTLTITVPLTAAETAARGGTGTMTITAPSGGTTVGGAARAHDKILDLIDHLIREGSVTVAYS